MCSSQDNRTHRMATHGFALWYGSTVPPVLTVLAPGRPAVEYEVHESPFVLGRDPTVNLVLNFPFISRRQLRLESDGDGWRVETEGRNEVRLDGSLLGAPTSLVPGARLELGPITVLFDVVSNEALSFSEGSFDGPTLELSRVEVENQSAQLGRMADMIRQLSQKDSMAEVRSVIARTLLEGVSAEGACVVELQGEAGHNLAAAGRPIQNIGRAFLRRAQENGGAVAMASPPALAACLGAASDGVVYAQRASGGPPFGPDDVAFAAVLAHVAGPVLARVERTEALRTERLELLRDIERRGGFGRLVGTSPPMRALASSISKVAPTGTTVLVTGETGAGKELVAREVHQRSLRHKAPFFALNCAALPEALVESELFGHRKGAFSGASEDRRGIFEAAHGGTVFLDEIGELPLAAQAKVLRVLDTGEILPLGSGRTRLVDVRLVAATHRDLSAEVDGGRFRADLFFRLKVFPIKLPALRSRKEDLPALVQHFFEQNPEARRKLLQPPTAAFSAVLESYAFPGNVRELAHIVEQACILADDGESLDVMHLPHEVAAVPDTADVKNPVVREETRPLRAALAAYERALILEELEATGWNRTKAAKSLQVSLRAFMDKLKRYGIKGPSRSS